MGDLDEEGRKASGNTSGLGAGMIRALGSPDVVAV